ncbi:hypothetical protein [Bacillus sp. LLTC93]|uniref:hypothetical protein n=1 Tax=Bacillus sp. LLTC93 TaxID=2108274 RepID=UPI000D0157E6|nr:hypothetical protein [Bacillus sp. LLTC93]PRO41468.1 hypothetical protein C6W18_05500 [Bacillus sp. LLTC93]
MAALKGVKTLDMVDGEITKVSYEGAEFERVEGGAKVGDLLMSKAGCCDITAGAFYIINEIDRDGDTYFYDDGGDLNALYRVDYVPFRKKHVRLKVGDYAKVAGAEDLDGIDEGDIVWVADDAEDDEPYLISPIAKRRKALWVREETLVPATDAEITAAKEAKAQRTTKWASIGRKVDEYKVGDIVAYVKDGEICEVGLVDDDKVGCLTKQYGICREWPNKITLITPVEARFDRS